MIVATIGRTDHVLTGARTARRPHWRRGGARHQCGGLSLQKTPDGRRFRCLELAPLLKAGRALKLGDIPKMREHQRLPLGEMQARDPGTFELVYETLHWWPTGTMRSAYDRGRCALELLDAHCKPLGSKLQALPATGEDLKFRLTEPGLPPVFARFRHRDGTMSCIAVIARTQELQAQTRDPLTPGPNGRSVNSK